MAAWTPRAELDPLSLRAAPAELIEHWMRAVHAMDRDALDTFVRWAWRSWSPTSLRPVAAAVDFRRAQLDGE
jgi:hypothetical protein